MRLAGATLVAPFVAAAIAGRAAAYRDQASDDPKMALALAFMREPDVARAPSSTFSAM